MSQMRPVRPLVASWAAPGPPMNRSAPPPVLELCEGYLEPAGLPKDPTSLKEEGQACPAHR